MLNIVSVSQHSLPGFGELEALMVSPKQPRKGEKKAEEHCSSDIHIFLRRVSQKTEKSEAAGTGPRSYQSSGDLEDSFL